MQEDSYEKDKKSKSTKVLKWHGNEEQTNIYVHHMLQSYGVQAVSYLKTKVIMKLIFWHQQSYLDLKVSVSIFPNGLASMIKVHTSVGREIHMAGRIH